MALRFLLEPGDMMLWHNYTNLHSRTSFEDDPASPRLLLRLWLSVPNGRPADPKFKMRAETYERIYRERMRESSELRASSSCAASATAAARARRA